MTPAVLVDTSVWIDALHRDGDPEVRAPVRRATAEGEAVLCDLVRLELWNGAGGAEERDLVHVRALQITRLEQLH